jgi:CBS domain-containing protein
MYVKDIMSDKIVTINCDESIRIACNKFLDHNVGCLVVTENDEIRGIVTERDVIKRTICMDRDPNTTPIKEIMTVNVKTIDMMERVQKAIEMIKEYKIKKLPVVFNGRLVGMVTSTDIAYSRPTIKEFLGIRND